MTTYTYHKEIRTILSQVINAFDGIILKRFNVNPAIPDTIDNVKVRVVYAPKSRTLFDIVNKNQHLKLPVMSVALTSLDHDPQRQFNKNEGVYKLPDENGKIGPYWQPVPINFSLTTSFICKFQSDADQFITCLFNNINPYFTISYQHPEMSDKEVRVKVEWDGNLTYNYPKDLNESTSYRLVLEASFKCTSWIYKNSDDLVGMIYDIPISWTATNILSDIYEQMHPLENEFSTDRLNVPIPTRSMLLYVVPTGVITLNFVNNFPSNVEINWGDGTYETFKTVGTNKKSHTYADSSEYLIRVKTCLPNQITLGTIESGTHVNILNNTRSEDLKEVSLSTHITKVDDGAFLGCTELHTVGLASSVIEIGDRSFYQCRSLQNIIIPSSVTTIGSMAFYGCVCLKYMLLKEETVNVGFMAFDGCEKLERVDFSTDCVVLEYGMFAKNTNLSGFIIPSGVVTIQFGAFTQCDTLTRISIPSNVLKLSHGCFYWCDNLQNVFFEKVITSVNDIEIESEMFLDCGNLLNIYVPDESVATYQGIPNLQPYVSLIKPRSLY